MKTNEKNKKENENKVNNNQFINFIKLSNSILEEINLVRTNPSKYYQKLDNWRQYVTSESINLPNKPVVKVENAENILIELMEFLKVMNPVNELSSVEALTNTAQDFIYTLQLHEGIDSKAISQCMDSFMKRIRKYGKPYGSQGESIYYGCSDPELIILNLLLGAEDIHRTDRRIILNPYLRLVGIACGNVPNSTNILTVIDLCEEFYNFNEYLPDNYRTTFERSHLSSNQSTFRLSKAINNVSIIPNESEIDPNDKSFTHKLATTFFASKDPIAKKNVNYLLHQINKNPLETNSSLLKKAANNIEIRQSTQLYNRYNIEKENLFRETYFSNNEKHSNGVSPVKQEDYRTNSNVSVYQTLPNITNVVSVESDFEINDKIDYINIKKTPKYEGDKSFYLVNKKVFYSDGTTEEFLFREDMR